MILGGAIPPRRLQIRRVFARCSAICYTGVGVRALDSTAHHRVQHLANTKAVLPVTGLTPEALVALRAAHLQMIQGIVGRMSGSSAALKGFCVTVTGAIIALKGDELGARVFWLLVLVALFAMCDAGYLRMERDFRRFYATVAKRPLSAAEDMGIERPRGHASGYVAAMVSWSVAAFYLFVALAVVLIGALAGK